MSNKAIILTANDDIEVIDFGNEKFYDFLKKTVMAENEDLNNTYVGFYRTAVKFPCIDEETGKLSRLNKKMCFCYNDNFLVTNFDDFEKINALATFILEIEMRGNVVLALVNEEKEKIEITGFNDKEVEIILKSINDFKKQFLNEISQLHEEYDNSKGKLICEIIKK